jgi:5,10-methylenetetrahydrofolate reductase
MKDFKEKLELKIKNANDLFLVQFIFVHDGSYYYVEKINEIWQVPVKINFL